VEGKDQEKIRDAVRQRYGEIAKAEVIFSGCSPQGACCGTAPPPLDAHSMALGYSSEELAAVPEGANMGLGCGNPGAIASLQPGETVLDLGSGAGFDCFIAARKVGEGGRVIGVDMTPDMLRKARENAAKAGTKNVEFRLGEIEHLPVADGSVDVVISNCVINLSPDKPGVYREMFRVLKPGGRLAISDVVASRELPEAVRKNMALVSCCIGGAETVENIEAALQGVGFEGIKVLPEERSRAFIKSWFPGHGLEDYVVSAAIEAVKPGPR